MHKAAFVRSSIAPNARRTAPDLANDERCIGFRRVLAHIELESRLQLESRQRIDEHLPQYRKARFFVISAMMPGNARFKIAKRAHTRALYSLVGDAGNVLDLL